MARIRSVKPAFFRSIAINKLPIATRLTFIGLWTYVDDEGRGVDDARLVKAELWPLDDKYTAKKVEEDLDLLARCGRIVRYTVASRTYFAITNWHEHQKINRPQESSVPAPEPFTDDSVNDHGTDSDDSLLEGKGKEGRRARKVPRDFAVNEDMRAWAKAKPILSDIDRETEKFVNYWTSNAKTRVDWEATWRNWMIQADDYAAKNGRNSPMGDYTEPQPDWNSPPRARVR